VTPLQVVYGAVLFAAFAMKGEQLYRIRRGRAERVGLVVYLGSLLAKLACALAPVSRALDHSVAPGTAKASQMFFSIVALYALIVFFLYAAGSVRRARWEIVPAAAIAAGMSIALFSAPAPLRPLIFEKAGPSSLAAVFFIVLGNAYLSYGLVIALLAARRYARTVQQHQTRVALVITSVGLTGAFSFAPAAQMVSVLVRHAGGVFPARVDNLVYVVATLFSMVAFVGLSWAEPAAAAIRWRQRRAVVIGLRDLAVHLHPVFPEIALDGPPKSSARERVDPRRMGFRYERRKVECRDALWTLGPWVAGELPSCPTEQGPAVLAALRAKAAGEPPAGHDPVTIADPASVGDTGQEPEAAEDRALVDLARSVRASAGAAAVDDGRHSTPPRDRSASRSTQVPTAQA